MKKKKKKPITQVCSRCKESKPFTAEFFPRRKLRKWGLELVCRLCTCRKAKIVNKAERTRLRFEVLNAYSPGDTPRCACCDERHIEFLALDHIAGGGQAERKKYPATMLARRLRRKGYPKGYRTLCHNCNSSYGLYGYCPHQTEPHSGVK